MLKIPFINTLQKNWDELNKFKPYVIEELHRLFISQDRNKIKISRTKENKLDKLSRLELLEILKKLSKEHILYLEERNFPKRQLKNPRAKYSEFNADSDFITITPKENEPIYFRLFPAFSNWYTAYLVRKNMKLEDLSFKALEHIHKWLSKIYEKFELNPNPEIILIEKDFKGDGLDFLYDKGIVKSHSLGYQGLDNEYEVKITLDVEKFIKFKPELEKTYLTKLDRLAVKKIPKNAIELPPNTKWQNITIKFKDGHNVDIKIKDKTIRADYKEMGFEDKKKRLPNQQWRLLEKFSENNGEISWNDSESSLKLKKKKQLLSQTLKTYFQIDEDPFLPYKQEKAYKIKINLIQS